MTTNIVNGIPTAPDVQALIDEFPSIAEGDFIPYGDIEEIIKVEHGSGRFISVTTAWRKKLFQEQNLLLKAVPGEGYQVLDPAGRVDFSGKKFVSGLRFVKRAGTVAGMTERSFLTTEQTKTLDHIVNTAAMIKLTSNLEARKLRVTAPSGRSTH